MLGLFSYGAVSYMVLPFDIFESAHAVHVKSIQSIAIMGGQVPCIRATQQCKGDQCISNLVCRKMQWRFHSCSLANTGSDFGLSGAIREDDSAELCE